MRRGLACLVLFTVAGPLAAQPASLPAIQLIIRATPAPVPALKYQLLPTLREQTHGNAALLYQRAHSPEWISNIRRSPKYREMSDWLNLPLREIPGKVSGFLPRGALRELDLAARREYCDWEMTGRVKKEGYGMLMPDIQGFREFATMLALRARLEMAQGKLDQAVYTLRTGVAMGWHLGDSPTLISALVGMAITQIMIVQMEDLIQLPGSPNLYWALTTLPRPLISLRKPMQGENLFLDADFPELRTIETTLLSSAQQQSLLSRLTHFIAAMEGRRSAGWQGKLAVVGLTIKAYPGAKRALIARGRKAAEVEALPALQVVLIEALYQFRRHRDNLFKWNSVPYWKAREGIQRANRDIRKAKASLESLNVLIAVLPAVNKVMFATARVDRKIAALRCIEAIRLYAAAHGGKLPASLDDVKDVPIPIDPVTGKGFEYKRDGDRATLYGPPPGKDDPTDFNTVYYQLTLKR